MNLSPTTCLLLINLFSIDTALAGDNGKDQQETQPLANPIVITLDTETQKRAGIETTRIKPAKHKTEFTAHGKAITLQPLLTLRNRYLVALTDHHLAAAKFKQAEQGINRQQELYRSGVSSKRLLQDQQIQWQHDKSRLDAAAFQTQSIREEALINWGKVLTEWCLSTDSDKLSGFLSGQQTLLQITLPADKQLSDDTKTIFIELSGNRSKAHIATLISKAPQSDVGEQGPSYFFRTNGNNIAPGMRVAAWVAEPDSIESGVMIPKSALVWSLEQALVYIKMDEEKFSHRVITDYSVTTDGYFTHQDIKPGEEIVTTGAQLLISEELREQIPHEQDSD